jgi:glycosyltransferase involved in cell wall biosynthesis
VDTPLVSCLMVTQLSRREFFPRAIAAFNRQTYPNRELVIVSVDDVEALTMPLVVGQGRFQRAPATAQTLGALRNVSLAAARGTYVATWDDDDWSHPERLAQQMAALQAKPEAEAFVLAQEDAYAEAPGWPHTAYSSMLALRKAVGEYPEHLHAPSDRPVLVRMRIATVSDPKLFVRVIHGTNICNIPYAIGTWFHHPTSVPLSPEAVAALKSAMQAT